MMGPKVGDFMQNSVGIDQDAVTVDLWMARTYNRLIGRLTDVAAKIKAEGGLADQVRERTERGNIKKLVREAASQTGIAPSAMQAACGIFSKGYTVIMASNRKAKTSAAPRKKRSSSEAVTLSGEPISKVQQAAQEMQLEILKKAYAKRSSPGA